MLTVSELSATIRDALETKFQNVWVEGEISNARLWNTGHLYFTLKDSASQIKGVMFRSALRYLKFKPEDGPARGGARKDQRLRSEGRIPDASASTWSRKGFGPLQVAFEQLKKKLAAEGLFDAARKRPLPALPRRIGLVTSIDGAALRDMVRVLRRRYPNAHLVISPSRVQGEGAAGEVARAAQARRARPARRRRSSSARGGGSLEDLWAFNDEAVARAIAASPVPVISGVGHETDVTIATSSPTCARPRRRPRRNWWCGARTSSSRTSTRTGGQLAGRAAPSPAPDRIAAALARSAAGLCRVRPAAWRFAAGMCRN